MTFFPLPLRLTILALALSACTTQEKQLVQTLENLPGVTCDIGTDGAETNCHPDSLSATQGP